jgi:hypothetical protein
VQRVVGWLRRGRRPLTERERKLAERSPAAARAAGQHDREETPSGGGG